MAPMFGSFFQTLITAVVWIVANVVYLDMKRKGVGGFTRLAAFWAGTPTTWITFFAVRDGVQPTFEEPADDDELLEAIRRDRALRKPEEDGESSVGDGDPTGGPGESTGGPGESTGVDGDPRGAS